MKKILCSVILIAALMLNATGAFAYEYAPYVGDGIIKATSVLITDAEGNEVTTLTPGMEITASLRASVGSDSLTGSEKLSLILAAYSEGFLEDVSIDAKTITSATDFTASITVPDVKPGIRVFLWDEVEGTINARPLFSMGETPAETSGITQISIGGQLIEGFSADVYEYDVTVNAGYTSWPEVIAFTGNTMTKVTATYEGTFPLSLPDKQVVDAQELVTGTSKTAVATITAGDKTYKINVTQEIPQITDVTVTYKNKSSSVEEVWPEVKNIKVYHSCAIDNIKWTDELPGPNKESATGMSTDRLSEYATYISDTKTSGACPAFAGGVYHYWYNLSPELIGAQQIIIEKETGSTGPVIATESPDYISFTIERSARIYAYVDSTSSSLTAANGWTAVVNEIYSSSEKAVRGVYATYIGTSATAYTHNLISNMKYKDVEVNPGEKVNVKIPKGKAMGHTFIKYYDDSEIAINGTYQYGTTSAVLRVMPLFKPVLADDTLTGTDLYKKYKSAAGESAALTKDTVADGTGNVLFGSSVFGNSAAEVPTDYDERFDGANYLRLRTTLPELQYMNFTLTAPAKVYVLTNITGNDFEAVKNVLSDWNIMGEGEENLITFHKGTNGAQSTYVITEQTSFEKEFYMDFGETKTVNLDFSGMSFPANKIFMVLIKPLN